jgi:hypothetical protein
MFDVGKSLRGFMQRHGVSFVLLTMALVCYSIGFGSGTGFLVGVGALFEVTSLTSSLSEHQN